MEANNEAMFHLKADLFLFSSPLVRYLLWLFALGLFVFLVFSEGSLTRAWRVLRLMSALLSTETPERSEGLPKAVFSLWHHSSRLIKKILIVLKPQID